MVNDTGDCNTAGWTSPSFATPYTIATVGVAPNQAKVGFIGVTTQETPYITIAGATEGLCFKDPAASIINYYDTLKAQVDVIVVLAHLGLKRWGIRLWLHRLWRKNPGTEANRCWQAGAPDYRRSQPYRCYSGNHHWTDNRCPGVLQWA